MSRQLENKKKVLRALRNELLTNDKKRKTKGVSTISHGGQVMNT
jgi:hypothetical protein